MAVKKLIEVALPLEKINAESAREKSIRHGHPSTLHLWWARRPLAAARAVIWSSLVDDPSSHPELFPTEEEQNRERQRLFKILEDLVVWENSNNKDVLDAAKAEILKSTNNDPPALLDPFAGGGAIPLEAQRLGLEAHAHDLNPVAVMINKAMIEIPPRFMGCPPVNPNFDKGFANEWINLTGLSTDVKLYGDWIKGEAKRRIEYLYPKVRVPSELGGGTATVISWIWTRTVTCPNPACGCKMPLASSFVLSSRKGREAYVVPECDYASKVIKYKVHTDKGKPPEAGKTARGAKFKCIMCGETTTPEYIKEQGMKKHIGMQLLAVVAEGKNGRIYISPDETQELAALTERPENVPTGKIGEDRRALRTPLYGLTDFSDLFTSRQLVALTTFCDLIQEVGKIAETDAVQAGMKDDHVPLSKNGTGAKAYSEAIEVYLSFALSRMTNIFNALCRWESSRAQSLTLFSRQGIPMIWDFAENNSFANAAGDFTVSLGSIIKVLDGFQQTKNGEASQYNAEDDCGMRNIMVSTDPPYYDNIGYAELSDFFYVWLRRNLKETYSDLFSTMLVPKAEELIATPYRHNGSTAEAKTFFEDGMLKTCKQIYQYAREDVPVTIYYAYKQSETDTATNTTASSGWETMLAAIVNAGFAITGTWPMRTEMANRAVASGTNALASSIVLVCRKRPENAPQTTRRNLVATLRRELRPALKQLQASNIAPVDLAQSAIGPGMGVFSRYRRVLEADGTPMSVRSALQVINEEIDLYFNEQIGDLDTASRFCVDLYIQNAYNEMRYGEAEVLANAKSTSIPMLAANGVLYAKAGMVHLIERDELPETVNTEEKNIWLLTQQLTRAMAKGGIEACAQIVFSMMGSNAERAKDLAYRLYTIAEQKKWTNEGYAYNALVVAWPDIQTRAAALKLEQPEQLNLFDL